MDEIVYITPSNSKFYKNNGGFLGLQFGEKDYKRVSLHKAFPFSHGDNYISVRDKDGKEVGLIKKIDEFSAETINLLKEELERRYFLPLIKSIKSVKEEFGYAYWDVITNLGPQKFTIRKDNNSFLPVNENRILVIDVDGNRYEIQDYTALDQKSYRLIELMI